MSAQPDAWLAALMARPAFRVDHLDDLAVHIASQQRAFYYSKVDTKDVETVRRLREFGFFVADTNVTFELRRPSQLEEPGREIVVKGFEPAHQDHVLSIAGSAYRYSRFHLDPLVGLDLAHTIKREWARNYCLGKRGDRLFVALRGDTSVGFLAALASGTGSERAAIVDLVAVDQAHQNLGVGTAMVRAFVSHYRETCGTLRVGTQVANVPSIRLYERAGFSLVRSDYVLHLHVS